MHHVRRFAGRQLPFLTLGRCCRWFGRWRSAAQLRVWTGSVCCWCSSGVVRRCRTWCGSNSLLGRALSRWAVRSRTAFAICRVWIVWVRTGCRFWILRLPGQVFWWIFPLHEVFCFRWWIFLGRFEGGIILNFHWIRFAKCSLTWQIRWILIDFSLTNQFVLELYHIMDY